MALGGLLPAPAFLAFLTKTNPVGASYFVCAGSGAGAAGAAAGGGRGAPIGHMIMGRAFAFALAFSASMAAATFSAAASNWLLSMVTKLFLAPCST